MRYEKSCGAVVFTRKNEEIFYLLVRQLGGFYSFPKGHMEAGETEIETAAREIYEETGLKVDFVPGFRTEDSHLLHEKPGTVKQITYFLAEYAEQDYRFQEMEISGGGLYTFGEAMKLFQYESSKRILRKANDFLLGK